MISEKQFQGEVVQLAKLLGWKHYHTHNSRRSPEGFPDLVLVKARHQPIYAELKSEKGTVSDDQQQWLDLLAKAGQRAFVWRPDDLEQIAQLLNETATGATSEGGRRAKMI
jgi:hypothetical protein